MKVDYEKFGWHRKVTSWTIYHQSPLLKKKTLISSNNEDEDSSSSFVTIKSKISSCGSSIIVFIHISVSTSRKIGWEQLSNSQIPTISSLEHTPKVSSVELLIICLY